MGQYTKVVHNSVSIPFHLIDDDPKYNCRGNINNADWLAKDIAEKGLMQPIMVRPIVNGQYQYRVVAGFTRFMALRLLRWKEVPAVVRDCTDEEASFLNLTENLTRRDLGFMQEAEAVRKIIYTFPHLTDEKIADRVGQSAGWVKVRLYALQLPPEVREVIDLGFLTQEHILTIFKMKTKDEQLRAIRKIKEARERGIKGVKLHEKKPKLAQAKEPRSRTACFAMIAHIKESLLTYNFGTRCLAWAAGEISDFELFGDIKNIADNEEIPYTKPIKLDMRSEMEKIRDGQLKDNSDSNVTGNGTTSGEDTSNDQRQDAVNT